MSEQAARSSFRTPAADAADAGGAGTVLLLFVQGLVGLRLITEVFPLRDPG